MNEMIMVQKIATTYFAVHLPYQEPFMVNSETVEILKAKKVDISYTDMENPEKNLKLVNETIG
ncbi:MAG: hypothetical protein FIA82_11905 [Melioribacter sp.]|nr:hypothetical protein [Melioribacter sp.]